MSTERGKNIVVRGLSDSKDAMTWIKDLCRKCSRGDLSGTQLSSFWLKKKEDKPNVLVITVGEVKRRIPKEGQITQGKS